MAMWEWLVEAVTWETSPHLLLVQEFAPGVAGKLHLTCGAHQHTKDGDHQENECLNP